jgi:hypothetical protein
MLTHAQLRTRIEQHTAFDLDNFLANGAGEVAAGDLTGLVNYGIRCVSVGARCNYDHKIVLTLAADTHVFDCRDITTPVVGKKVLEPRRVTINGKFLRNPNGEYGMWTMPELENDCPSYQTYTSSKPSRAVWLPGNKLLLSRPPNAATVTDGNNFISGWHVAADIAASDSAQPDLPEELHEAVVDCAAIYAATPSASEAEGWQRLVAYTNRYNAIIDKYERINKALLIGPLSRRGARSDWLRDVI